METPLTRLLREKLDQVLDGNETELARQVGTSQQNINNYLTGKVMKPHYWRAVNKVLGIEDNQVRSLIMMLRENPQYMRVGDPRSPNAYYIERPPNATPQPLTRPTKPLGRMIPVLGEAVGGVEGKYVFNGTVIDYIACPPSLENVRDAYAVYIDGESMWPRYKPGETVWVHPGKPARRGDDVIVQIQPPEDDGSPPWGYVKELVGWTGNKLKLLQYNPHGDVEFDREVVVSVHPIVLSGKY